MMFRKMFLLAAILSVALLTMVVTPPAEVAAQGKVLTVLAEDHWSPSFNPELKKQVADWAKMKGVEARVDFISSRVVPIKMAGEAESKKGHDLVYLYRFDPALFKENLVAMDDVAKALEKENGPWREGGRYLNFLDGHWYGIPYFGYLWPAVINTQHWKTAGLDPDKAGQLTWDQFLEVAKKLKEVGHPVAAAISEDFDSDSFLYPMLWSFGGRTVDEQGKVIANSPQTRAMFEYLKKLYPYMPPEVKGWGGADNNVFMHSGMGSWTINPATIWSVAKLKNLPVVSQLDHALLPSGPAGRYIATWDISLGIWNFSPNVELAKDLIRYLLTKDNFYKQVSASLGVNQPYFERFSEHPIYRQERVLRNLEPMPKTAHPFAWPARPGSGTQIEINTHVLAVAAQKYISGDATLDEAVSWLDRSLKLIHRK